jgi:hypothetical protein
MNNPPVPEIDNLLLEQININTEQIINQNQNSKTFQNYESSFHISKNVKFKYGLKNNLLSCYFEKGILEDPPQRVQFVLQQKLSDHPEDIKE